MRPRKFLVLMTCYMLLVQRAISQEVIEISQDHFAQNGELHLDHNENWLFKSGNNPDWAKKELDVSDWKKLAPAQLSVDQTDENGRLEGWFRLRFKVNSSLNGI